MKASPDRAFNLHVTVILRVISHMLNRQHIEVMFVTQVATELSLTARIIPVKMRVTKGMINIS
jgi:hypothetical protein